MKLTNALLASAIAHVGFDFDMAAMTVLTPISDHGFDGSIQIIVHDTAEFGKIGVIGKHCAPMQLGTISRALADCYDKGCGTLHLYVDR